MVEINVSPIKQPPPLLLHVSLQVFLHSPAHEDAHFYPHCATQTFVQLSLQPPLLPPLLPPLSPPLISLLLVILVKPEVATAVTVEPDAVKVKVSCPAADTASLTYYRSAKLKFCYVPSTCLIKIS